MDNLSKMKRERPLHLVGYTYKIKPGDYAYYITINNIIDTKGAERPYEIFVNSKDISNYCYLLAICRLISAFLQTGHEFTFIAEELSQIHDSNFHYLRKGKSYPSLLAMVGEVLDSHFKTLNLKGEI